MDDETQIFLFEEVLRNGVEYTRAVALHLGELEFDFLLKYAAREPHTTFRQLWNEQHTASLNPASFVMMHRLFGNLRFRSIRVLFPAPSRKYWVIVSPDDQSTKELFTKLEPA